MKKKFQDPAVRDRAAALAKMVLEAKPTERELTFAIWCALDEARNAGFAAGCAFARSRMR